MNGVGEQFQRRADFDPFAVPTFSWNWALSSGTRSKLPRCFCRRQHAWMCNSAFARAMALWSAPAWLFRNPGRICS